MPRRCTAVAVAVGLLVCAAAGSAAQDASSATQWKDQLTADGPLKRITEYTGNPEEALSQLTTAFAQLLGSSASGGLRAGGSVSDDVAAAASRLRERLAGVAEGLFGQPAEGVLEMRDDGKLTVNLGGLLGGLSGDLKGLDVSLALTNTPGGAGVVKGIQDALTLDYSASVDAFLTQVQAYGATLAAEAVVPLGGRIADRVLQVGQILTEATNQLQGGEDGEACGVYTFNPGGAPVEAEWSGPTFTLTQATGVCEFIVELDGEGVASWTNLVERLACEGPSLQYEFTPLRYQGPSREPESLECPECKVEFTFGPEIEVTLYGGDEVQYASEAEFYAAVVTNATFDWNINALKTFLVNLQSRLDSGETRISDVLRINRQDGSQNGAVDALSKLLGESRLVQGLDGAAKTLQQQVTEAYSRYRAGLERGPRGWLNADGSFNLGSYLKGLTDKVAQGGFVLKGLQGAAPAAAAAA